MRAMDDEDFQLIREFQNGDASAFERLVKKYQDRVFNVIYCFTGRKEDTQDLAQDVFLKLYTSLSQFKFESSFYSWLYRITLNVCIDDMRRRKLRRLVSLSQWFQDLKGSKSHPTPDEVMEQKELGEIIQQGLNQLSKDYRAIIILRDIEGLSYKEIAGVLGCSSGTVKSRLSRARVALREKIKPYLEGKL